MLGDRIRLETNPNDKGLFIRSMAARDKLGGLASITLSSVFLLNALFDLTIIETTVTSENIVDILFSNNFGNNLDILSLDVDGIDYWIIEALSEEFSKIVVVEYNSIFAATSNRITTKNTRNFRNYIKN